MKLDKLAMLKELLSVAGPSGYEKEAVRTWVRIAQNYGLEASRQGTDGVAKVAASEDNAPTVLFDAHIDEIGLLIHYIDDEGRIWAQEIGGWDPVILLGQRVCIYSGRDYEFITNGVIGRTPIHLQDEDNNSLPKIEDICIDIGSTNKRQTLDYISVGDYIVIDAPPIFCSHDENILISKALDDRIGAWILIQALVQYSQLEFRPYNLIAVASAREEIGDGIASSRSHGKWKANHIVVIDGSHASDQPNVEIKQVGERALGSGPAICVGAMLDREMIDKFQTTAESLKIPYTIEVSAESTRTNADPSWEASPESTISLLGIPLRYMHSPVEMVDIRDVNNAIQLIVQTFSTKP